MNLLCERNLEGKTVQVTQAVMGKETFLSLLWAQRPFSLLPVGLKAGSLTIIISSNTSPWRVPHLGPGVESGPWFRALREGGESQRGGGNSGHQPPLACSRRLCKPRGKAEGSAIAWPVETRVAHSREWEVFPKCKVGDGDFPDRELLPLPKWLFSLWT